MGSILSFQGVFLPPQFHEIFKCESSSLQFDQSQFDKFFLWREKLIIFVLPEEKTA